MTMLHYALLLPTLLLAGCATNCAAGEQVGLVTFGSAVDARTGAPIATVNIVSATLDGQDAAQAPSPLLLKSGVNGAVKNMRYENAQVLCDVICSFGPPGTYVLKLAATGYQPQELRFTVERRAAGTVLGVQFGCGGVTTGTPRSFDLKFTPL